MKYGKGFAIRRYQDFLRYIPPPPSVYDPNNEGIFCQNSGACGSMYIVELLKQNGMTHCYHEKFPDLDELGVLHNEGNVPESQVRNIIRWTRNKVNFEANNRIFAMSKIILESYPKARFIHLHRDPRHFVPSGLSKEPTVVFESSKLRYKSPSLVGDIKASPLVKLSHYWNNYNQRILNDLQGLDFLSLKFSDLIDGRVEGLEAFLNFPLKVKKLPPVNNEKGIRDDGEYPEFSDWSQVERDLLLDICGETMQQIGYTL